MRRYKYIFATGGLILGAIIGYGIGWLLSFGSLFLLGNVGGGGRIRAWLTLLLSFLPIVIAYGFPTIGAIWGWRYGYKIGEKKEKKQRKIKK